MAGYHRSSTEEPLKALKRAEMSLEVSPYNKRPCLENTNGHPPSHLYLAHSMAYANRYLHYSVPDSMALHSLPLPGKGPAYPHPVLLGSSSLYPSHLAAKQPLPYHSHSGEYLTYNSQEMAHPLMHAHPDSKALERADQGPKCRDQGQDKHRGLTEDCGGSRRGRSGVETGEGSHVKPKREAGERGGSQPRPTSSSSLSTPSKDHIVCIDLVHSDTDGESTPTTNKPQVSVTIARGNQHKCCHGNENIREVERKPKHQLPSSTMTTIHTDRQPETLCVRPRPLQETGCPSVASSPPQGSPKLVNGAEEKSVGDTEESYGEGDEDEEGGRRGSRRTSLTKRIASSLGYVGDRIKCVTTELYADSSKLSREQRALQVS
uniref:BCL6 corepressor n=1 Tax=Hucho hucho TaxID=62062 RepID=A0A4W5K6H7_9TELE